MKHEKGAGLGVRLDNEQDNGIRNMYYFYEINIK